MTQLIALKLGSTTTTIFKQGEGLVLKEPSYIAVAGSLKSREIKAVGKEAKRMLGRTSGGVSVIAPINNGIVTDSDLASSMLKIYLKRIFPRRFLKPHIKAVLCTPLGLSVSEKKNFEKVCYNAGIADVTMIPAIICSAIGDDIPVDTSTGKLLVTIGGGTTNIAVIANNTIVSGINISVGGTMINTAIENMIQEKFNANIGEGTADKVKNETLSLLENDTSSIEIQGVNASTHETQNILVSSQDVYPIANHYYGKIAEAIASVVTTCPPDIVSDINREGVYIYGSHSQISGIDKFFKSKLGLKINLSETFKTDIHGAAKLLDNPAELHEILKNL